MNKHIVTRVALALALVAMAAAPAVAGSYGKNKSAKNASAMKPGNIIQVATAAGSFKTLLTAIDAAGLTGTLSAKGKETYTVFAPTDEAFAKLPAGTVESLLKDTEKLKSILLYHVVAGQVKAADVVKLSTAKTVNGESVAIAVTDGAVKLNDANVVKTDIPASNGVIHVIDTVLIP